jgi:hypothetical protein
MKSKSILSIPFTGFLLILWIFSSDVCQAQETYFYDLRGMEGDSGTTHLFYRIYDEQSSTCAAYDPESDEYYQIDTIHRDQDIYHFDTWTESDSLFIRNYQGQDNFCELIGVDTKDIEFFEAHPDSFITYSVYAGFEANAVITDFKEISVHLGLIPPLPNITFDPATGHLIFGIYTLASSFFSSLSLPKNSELLQKNFFDFDEIPDSLSLSYFVYDIDHYSSDYISINEDSLFIYGESGSTLLSTDFSGYYEHGWDFHSFTDTTLIYTSNRLQHRFRPFRTLLKMERETDTPADTIRSGKFFMYDIDPAKPQNVIISDSLELHISMNYGNSFDLLTSFDTEITGIYKKPDSELIYVLTREELFAVNSNSGESISLKQLPVSSEPIVGSIPDGIQLHQNYPNPFNPTTVITYQLPAQSNVRLEVFDMLGRRVAVLVDEPQSPGTYSAEFDASNLASGVYLYRLQTGEAVQTRQMVLVK